MRAVYGHAVFSAGDREFTWSDVVLAAAARGEWREVAERALSGARALARAESADAFPLSDEAIESAANEFRYERDLVTAEEMEAWLDRWDLDGDAWMAWIASDLLREREEPDAGEPELSPSEQEAAIHSEAACSDALGRFAYRLAARVAISARLAAESPGPGDDVAGPDAAASKTPELDLLPFSIDVEEAHARLRELARLEAAYLAFRREIVTPQAIEARIRVHQTDWMRVDARVLKLPSEDVAREALLSIREEGCTFQEVARDAGGEVNEGVFFLEEFEPAVRDPLLAARKGDLLGPLPLREGFCLIEVVEKLLPSSADAGIALRATDSLLEAVEAREIENRVAWRWKK